MCGSVPCGGRSGSKRAASDGSSRAGRYPAGTRRTGRSRGSRRSRARNQRVVQTPSVRLGPLVKMKNMGEEPVVFDDAVAGVSRQVKPGDWVYVFEKQAEDLSAVGMEKTNG